MLQQTITNTFEINFKIASFSKKNGRYEEPPDENFKIKLNEWTQEQNGKEGVNN